MVRNKVLFGSNSRRRRGSIKDFFSTLKFKRSSKSERRSLKPTSRNHDVIHENSTVDVPLPFKVPHSHNSISVDAFLHDEHEGSDNCSDHKIEAAAVSFATINDPTGSQTLIDEVNLNLLTPDATSVRIKEIEDGLPLPLTQPCTDESSSLNQNHKELIQKESVSVGDYVMISKGLYKNQSGVIKRLTAKQAYIQLTDSSSEVRLNQDILIKKEKSIKEQVIPEPIEERSKKTVKITPFKKRSSSNSITDHSNDTASDLLLHTGSEVIVVGGKYRGKTGSVVRVTNKKAHIQLHHSGLSTCLLQSNLKIVADIEGHSESYEFEYPQKMLQVPDKGEPAIVGAVVYVVKGKYASKCGTLVKICDKTYKVTIDGQPRYFKRDLIAFEGKEKLKDDFRLPDHDKRGLWFGDTRISRLRVEPREEKDLKSTFLKYCLGKRCIDIDITFNKKSNSFNISRLVKFEGGSVYELIGRKVVKDSEESFLYRKQDITRFTYVQLNGSNHQNSFSPQDFLDRLGDFSSLSLRRQVARLELLSSPAYRLPNGEYCTLLKSSIISDIPERGHNGCGFLCERLLSEILGNNVSARAATSIQIPESESIKIFLPESMKKVPASKHPDRSQNAYLLICQAGVDPSQNCSSIDKIFHSGIPSASYAPKPLSKMISRLLYAWGVPWDVLENYSRVIIDDLSRKKFGRLGHAYMRGVADPTNEIPPNTCFITGFRNDERLINSDFVFVTRSPCPRASDGRRIKILNSKPHSISNTSYDTLNSLPFGLIIFGFPRDAMKSIPEMVAQSDLDGDRFFVCWDQQILSHVSADFITDELITEAPDDQKMSDSAETWNSGPLWFENIQSYWLREEKNDFSKLIGKLYKLSEESADADEVHGIRNKDAVAFSNAYIAALEHSKHGTNISLPSHLHHKVPLSLQKYLTHL